MINNQYIIVCLISFSFLFTSCFKEDDMIPKHTVGDIQSYTVEMGQYYMTQSYFDLGTNQNVSFNSKDIWDLAFSCNDSNIIIRLNSAKFMKAAFTNDTAFFSVSDTSNLKWSFDVASGNIDSLAIQNWYEIGPTDTTFSQKTYIIDLGINALGILQGVRKIKFLSYKNNIYRVQSAHLDNSDLQYYDIAKNSLYNYTQLKLEGAQGAVQLEPKKDNWDIFFTQYTDILKTDLGELYPYLVTGVLINEYKIRAMLETNLDFETTTLDDINLLDFQNNANVIGYQWKKYDFTAGIYEVNTQYTYIIRDTEGYYYKLRFVGFYNNLGEKGYPQFESQKL